MIIKPTIQNRSGGPLNMPTSMDVRVQASDQWWINNPGMDARFAVEQIMAQRQGDVMQFVYGSRQMSVLGGSNYQRNYRDWGDLRADFSFNGGMEMLRLVVLPENAPTYSGGSSQSFGDTFDVKWDFVAFPYPGSTQNGGQPDTTCLKLSGVMYVFDPCLSPSGPGPTSQYDSVKKVWTFVAPNPTPDLNDISELQAEYTGMIPILQPGQITGYTQAMWVNNVGGSGILSRPIVGKEYWEVEIVAVPSSVPNQYNYTPTTPSDGSTLNSPTEDVASGGSITYKWPSQLDTFLTPAIGVCPGYFLPNDMLPGSGETPPKKVQDYGRVLGLDPLIDPNGDKSKLARSVYVIPTSLMTGAITGTTQKPGHWEATYAGQDDSGILAGQGFYFNFVPQVITTYIGGSFTTAQYLPLQVANYTMVAHWMVASLTAAQMAGQFRGVAQPISTQPSNTPVFVCNDNIYRATPGTPPTPPSTEHYSMGDVFDAGTTYYVCISSGTGPGGGPTAGQPIGAFSWGAAQFINCGVTDGCQARIGGYIFDDQYAINFDGNPNSVTHLGDCYSLWNIRHVSGGTTAITPTNDACYGDGPGDTPTQGASLATTKQSMSSKWADLFTPPGGAPVWIGRMDAVHDALQYAGDGSDVPLDGSLATGTQKMGPVGAYTGVNLEKLEANDVVMVAADAATGYIWFGKNGQWYLSDGTQISANAQNPSKGPAASPPTGWAAVMDGMKQSATPITAPSGSYDPATFPPQYFPCVSYRMGPGEVKMIYDKGKLKYAPPAGFGVYGQVKVG